MVRFDCKAITTFIAVLQVGLTPIILTCSRNERGKPYKKSFGNAGDFFVYFFKVILKVVPSPTTEDLT